jgi:hypothetical protein
VVDVVALRELVGVLRDPLLGLGPQPDVLLQRGGLVGVLHGLDRGVERPGVVADTRLDRGGAVALVLREVGLRERLAERGHVDLLAGQRVDVGVVDAGHLHQLDVVLGEAGLLQHAQDERALGLAWAVGDLLALQVVQAAHVDAGRDAELVRRVLERVDGLASGDDLDVGAGPLREQRRDVGDGADVDRVRAERLERLGAAADVGPLDLDVELDDQAGELERGLGGRVTDAQHGALLGLVRYGGGQLQLWSLLLRAAAGEADDAEEDGDRVQDHERTWPAREAGRAGSGG